MLIDQERDDEALLRLEDQAIRDAETPKTIERTRLDELAEMLNGNQAPVHEAREG